MATRSRDCSLFIRELPIEPQHSHSNGIVTGLFFGFFLFAVLFAVTLFYLCASGKYTRQLNKVFGRCYCRSNRFRQSSFHNDPSSPSPDEKRDPELSVDLLQPCQPAADHSRKASHRISEDCMFTELAAKKARPSITIPDEVFKNCYRSRIHLAHNIPLDPPPLPDPAVQKALSSFSFPHDGSDSGKQISPEGMAKENLKGVGVA